MSRLFRIFIFLVLGVGILSYYHSCPQTITDCCEVSLNCFNPSPPTVTSATPPITIDQVFAYIYPAKETLFYCYHESRLFFSSALIFTRLHPPHGPPSFAG